VGQDNKFWEEWEKKYGKPTPTPEPVDPVAPVAPVTYAPSQFSLGPAGPAPFGPPAELQSEVLQAPTSAPTAAPIPPGWEDWEKRFGKTATAPVATTQTTAAPPGPSEFTGLQPSAPSPEGQGGFLDWASGVGGIFPQGKWSPFDVEGWKRAGGMLGSDTMKALTGLQDIANFFGQAHRTETLRQDVQNS